MIRKEDLFKIGAFAKPHGVKGEIGLITSSDVFEDSDDPYLICEMDGIFIPFFIEEYRYKNSTVILVKLENVDDEVAASEFNGKDVYYALDEMEDGDDLIGDISWDSFVGYKVTDERNGYLGVITDLDASTMNLFFKIDNDGKELLIPAVNDLILSTDHKEETLLVSLPDGLLDL